MANGDAPATWWPAALGIFLVLLSYFFYARRAAHPASDRLASSGPPAITLLWPLLWATLGLTSCQAEPPHADQNQHPMQFHQPTPAGSTAATAAYSRQEVIYARSFGTALTMDVFQPQGKTNGTGIVLFISEGWYSDHAKIGEHIPRYIAPLLAKGYTVFAVVHGSNPKFTLPENIEDAHRAVRFIRHHARDYGVDPDRLGSTGDSAGGHLALMVGCAGRPGQPQAPDPVDAESSRVQAVVAFFSPTDFLNWGKTGQQMLGQHPLVPLEGAFGFARLNPETNAFERITGSKQREAIGRQVSPITHVRPDNAPTLLVVGDADTFIPPQQSRLLADRLKAAGVASELLVMPGGGHDEATITHYLPQALAWFDQHLASQATPANLTKQALR